MGWGPILSRLRKLEAITYKIIKEEIPIIYDIETDDLYLKGMEKGMEKTAHNLLSGEAFLLGKIGYQDIAFATGLSVERIAQIHQELEES